MGLEISDSEFVKEFQGSLGHLQPIRRALGGDLSGLG